MHGQPTFGHYQGNGQKCTELYCAVQVYAVMQGKYKVYSVYLNKYMFNVLIVGNILT